jgi:predicted hotdog family 3-hydroxylacyl-ACP dehydratase
MIRPLLERQAILGLVPHQQAMCLWDQVLAFDADSILLRAFNHTDPAHPLRARGRLGALALCEYGAQAMAVHGGLLGAGSGNAARPGVLVALRDVRLAVARIDTLDGPLLGQAHLLASSAASQHYRFQILLGERELASGRAAAVLTDTPGPR